MLQNYLKITFRSLLRNKLYFFVSIAGLATAMTCVTLLFLYIQDEFRYDTHHRNADRTYRVVQSAKWEEGDLQAAVLPGSFAAYLQKDYPEIEKTARILGASRPFIRRGNELLPVEQFYFADPTLLDAFDYRFLVGEPQSALSGPNAMLLTRSMADKLFGSYTQAVGRTVSLYGNLPCVVKAVVEDLPTTSHFRYNGLISFSSLGPSQRAEPSIREDLDEQTYTYLVLREGASADALERKLPQFCRRYLAGELTPGMSFQLRLQPLTSIHLHSHLLSELGVNGNMTVICALSVTCLLLLLIAAINYINLATARATKRAKEVGVRKAVGSLRIELIGQFLTESVVLALIAFVVALAGAQALMPLFNELTGKQFTFHYLLDTGALYWLIGIALFCGLTSGGYPALFLSGLKPDLTLKGYGVSAGRGLGLRKGLVVFQFVISSALITATFIMYQQLGYLQTKPLGLNKEQVVTVRVADQAARRQLPRIKRQLAQYPHILGTAAAANPIGIDENVNKGLFWFETESRTMTPNGQLTHRLAVDYDFLEVMRIRLREGRTFSPAMTTDAQRSVVVNEALVRRMGWRQPVGKRLQFPISDTTRAEAVVIGVVSDFHLVSLHQIIEPIVLSLVSPEEADNAFIRIRPDHVSETMQLLEQTFRQADPNNPFEAHFLDENFSRQYTSDVRQGKLALSSAVAIILIACLGLFGLAAFSAEQRTKEIGIRKVMGASVVSIVLLLSRDILRLVVVALLLAAPLSLYFIDRWLQDFAYRVDIAWWVFALTGSMAVLIALLTVSFQSVKAALMNPVKSLRTE